MLNNKILIENIKKLCDKNNIKITNLEKELGFGAGIISRWGNDADPSLSKIIQVADYFHVSIDEVVGHNNIINDKFLEKLISQTEEKIIQWNAYDNENEDQPKQYFGFSFLKVTDFINIEDFNDFIASHKELSYYIQINNKYVSLYGQYNDFNITKPEELKLFIQISKESELIPQLYDTKQLMPLWLKVLYTMGASAPDEIKVEEFKNNFVLNNSKLNSKNTISKKSDLSDIRNLMSSPEVLKLMELYNQPAFREMQETLNNPEVQAAIQIANKLQGYFD